MFGNWNEYNLNPLTRIHWRASLVPAAAVIPAPIAYIKVAAVKKLVVGFLIEYICPAVVTHVSDGIIFICFVFCLFDMKVSNKTYTSFTLNKLECFKQAFMP